MATIDNLIAGEYRIDGRRTNASDFITAIAGSLSRSVTALLDWQDRARERRELACLSERALKDIAASRADAEREYEKPFWRA